VFVNLRRITVSALAALGLLLVGCSTSAQQARTAQELEVREAIVGYQIASWDLRADVYFLEIESKNPQQDFLDRFKDIPRLVKGENASKMKKDVAGYHIEDRRTKKRGVLFDQGPMVWKDDSTIDVAGGYDCATLCAGSGIYHLKQFDGRWKVQRFEIRLMS
jgi:hypothetical protein